MVRPEGEDGSRCFLLEVEKAEQLVEELKPAIEEAKKTPFERWWALLPIAPDNRRRMIAADELIPFTRGQAEALFKWIREVS